MVGKIVVGQIFAYAEDRAFSEKTACVFPDGSSISYAELAAGIRFSARRFRALRNCHLSLFEASDPTGISLRVLISAEKTKEFLFAYFGVHAAGLVAVPLDPECNAARLAEIAEFTSAEAICGHFLHENAVLKIQKISFTDFLVDAEKSIESTREISLLNKNTLADIVFTTGTTGTPKGVCLTHGNLAAAVRNINAYVGTCAEDVEVVALPICHSFGLGRVRCLLSVGATVVFVNGFASVKRLFCALRESRATGFAMVPAAWAYLKKISGEKLSEFSETLRYIEIGSASMPNEDKILLAKMFPRTRICMHYGLTEASRSAFCEFHEILENPGTIGHAAPNVQIAVFDKFGMRVPAGTVGEICVCGEHVTPGYWRSGDRHEDFFEGKFFRTGDLGCENLSGEFSLVGRIKEIVSVGGKKVMPQEVETVLNAFPEVEECACVGVSDPSGMFGEALKVCIVPARGFEGKNFPANEELRLRLAAHLENFKIPTIYEQVSMLPKTSSGKLQRGLLRN